MIIEARTPLPDRRDLLVKPLDGAALRCVLTVLVASSNCLRYSARRSSLSAIALATGKSRNA